ncbi:hypothetical protein EAE96_007649 [Botrytis aclada]|nr:hypothetical protein EAE96_007649 [Botrytis aclada]
MDGIKRRSARLRSPRICNHKRHALTNSSFAEFPVELIQLIADSLDVASAALFSISCKTIYHVVGPKYILRLTRHENLLFRRIIEYDIKNMASNGCCDLFCTLKGSSPAKGVSGIVQGVSKSLVDCRRMLNPSYRQNEIAASYLARDLHHHICFFAPYHRDDFPWTVEREVASNIIRKGCESISFQKEQVSVIRKFGSTMVRQRRIFQGKCAQVIRLRVDICAHLQCYSNSMHIRPRICPTSRDPTRDMTREYPERPWGLHWKKVIEETDEIERCDECPTEFSIRFVHVRDCIPNVHCRMELTITTWKELGPKVDGKIWREHFPEPQKYVPINIPRLYSPKTKIANAFTPLAVLDPLQLL